MSEQTSVIPNAAKSLRSQGSANRGGLNINARHRAVSEHERSWLDNQPFPAPRVFAAQQLC
jgi:hypothetical protein